jgi:uncharacterized membrane protein (DUF441 family)
MRKWLAILIGVGLILSIVLGEVYELALKESSASNWESKQIVKYCGWSCSWLAQRNITAAGGDTCYSPSLLGKDKRDDNIVTNTCLSAIIEANYFTSVFGVF